MDYVTPSLTDTKAQQVWRWLELRQRFTSFSDSSLPPVKAKYWVWVMNVGLSLVPSFSTRALIASERFVSLKPAPSLPFFSLPHCDMEPRQSSFLRRNEKEWGRNQKKIGKRGENYGGEKPVINQPRCLGLSASTPKSTHLMNAFGCKWFDRCYSSSL